MTNSWAGELRQLEREVLRRGLTVSPQGVAIGTQMKKQVPEGDQNLRICPALAPKGYNKRKGLCVIVIFASGLKETQVTFGIQRGSCKARLRTKGSGITQSRGWEGAKCGELLLWLPCRKPEWSLKERPLQDLPSLVAPGWSIPILRKRRLPLLNQPHYSTGRLAGPRVKAMTVSPKLCVVLDKGRRVHQTGHKHFHRHGASHTKLSCAPKHCRGGPE